MEVSDHLEAAEAVGVVEAHQEVVGVTAGLPVQEGHLAGNFG